MKPLAVHFIQSRIHWHNAADNRAAFEERIRDIPTPVDLIVLPETFASGFTQAPEACAETMDGDSVRWMQAMASDRGAVLAGSLVIEDDGYRNRLVWAAPDGQLAWYDKRHLFRMAGEHRRYRPGNQRVVVDLKGWRICLQVCYDLRFPAWTRQRGDYDLLLFVANWPSPRAHAWRTLLRARAIENQCYVVGVNRVGEDGNGLHYAGDSAAIDALGHDLLAFGNVPEQGTAILDPEALAAFRQDFPFQVDADPFTLETAPEADGVRQAG